MNNIDVKTTREELAQALSRTFDDSKGIAVYGAGDTAERWFAPFLEGEITPACFIDDTPGKAGTSLYNIPIIDSEEAHDVCRYFLILLCSIVPKTQELMADSLQKYPIEGAVVCPQWEEYIFCKHSKEILSIFDWLEDDISKETYANMILTRMGKTEQNPILTVPGQYFAITPFAKRNINEVFVDCGAYVGDTIERFLDVREGIFQQIVAFEPVKRNFQGMVARIRRLRREWALDDRQIKLISAGVGEMSYKTTIKLSNCADGCILSGENACGDTPVVSIDDYFSEQSISFLKADIEGYEWKMLHGAERVIKRDRPKLAICIYHTPFDMYRIALWIKSICPNYKFAVRQHYCDIWDTVLYAYS